MFSGTFFEVGFTPRPGAAARVAGALAGTVRYVFYVLGSSFVVPFWCFSCTFFEVGFTPSPGAAVRAAGAAPGTTRAPM